MKDTKMVIKENFKSLSEQEKEEKIKKKVVRIFINAYGKKSVN